jgi:hypothetical protein
MQEMWTGEGTLLPYTLSKASSISAYNEDLQLCMVGVDRVSIKHVPALALRTRHFPTTLVKSGAHYGSSNDLSAWGTSGCPTISKLILYAPFRELLYFVKFTALFLWFTL